MLTRLIDEYVESFFRSLNAYYNGSINIRRAKINLDLEKISAGESNLCYQTIFKERRDTETESPELSYQDVEIRFKFMIINKDSSMYRTILDRYVNPLYRMFKDERILQYYNHEVSISLQIDRLFDVKVIGEDNFDNEYFKPSISFTLLISDSGTLVSQQIFKSQTVLT